MDLARLLDGSTPSSNDTEKKEEQTKDKATIQQTSSVSPERKAQMEREHQYLQKRRTSESFNRKLYVEYDIFFC